MFGCTFLLPSLSLSFCVSFLFLFWFFLYPLLVLLLSIHKEKKEVVVGMGSDGLGELMVTFKHRDVTCFNVNRTIEKSLFNCALFFHAPPRGGGFT